MKNKKEMVYLRCMVIVHGKSELRICSSIRSNLRMKQEIISDKRGAKSIQINSLKNILSTQKFSTFDSFIREFPDIEHEKKKLKNFKLFIIMDVDDCSQENKNKFISGEMFATHWLKEYIIPIYNDPNLEKTMEYANIPIAKKKDYFIVFPTNEGDLDLKKAEEFAEKLNKCKNSNLYEYVIYCIRVVTGKNY